MSVVRLRIYLINQHRAVELNMQFGPVVSKSLMNLLGEGAYRGSYLIYIFLSDDIDIARTDANFNIVFFLRIAILSSIYMILYGWLYVENSYSSDRSTGKLIAV